MLELYVNHIKHQPISEGLTLNPCMIDLSFSELLFILEFSETLHRLLHNRPNSANFGCKYMVLVFITKTKKNWIKKIWVKQNYPNVSMPLTFFEKNWGVLLYLSCKIKCSAHPIWYHFPQVDVYSLGMIFCDPSF